jgi:DNA modification methylase
MSIEIKHGDCLEILAKIADNSIDAIVTDPPYGLSFMGKKWDYDVPSVEVWAECLRVLKPGGHLLAFAGTRTQHRMAVRIEDAGFEIRDMIAWVYGSGFPKSLDVSKAIDRMDASEEQERRRLRFTAWVRATGATSRQIDEATGTNMGGHYTTAASQPAIMTREHLEQCRYLLGDVPEWVEREADIRSVESKNFAERQVVGVHAQGSTPGGFGDHRFSFNSKDITAPATPEAQQWAGWGTALKPALEPITMARKPLTGTVAANVLEHGTGAINVDGCRVEGAPPSVPQPVFNRGTGRVYGMKTGEGRNGEMSQAAGRWPANLIHDGSDEVVGLFPEANSARANGNPNNPKRGTNHIATSYGQGDGKTTYDYRDTGSAARFFYCAKANKADRDEGCEGLPQTVRACGPEGHTKNATAKSGELQRLPRGNHHPTVKPTDLMRYLCRLVTPPGGTVLDPFMGSGSTGKAAALEGFKFIGIERDPEYIEIAKARIKAAQKQLNIFS